MILAALASLYERTVGTEDGPPPIGYAELPIMAAVNIGQGGEMGGLVDLRQETTISKKTRLMPARRIVPQPPPNRRGLRVEPGFLCDDAGYLLGYDGKGSPTRAAEQFTAERALHETVLAEVADPAATAVLAFFRGWDPSRATALLESNTEIGNGWLVLRDAESARFFHDIPAIRAAWARHAAGKDTPHGQCLVTGRDDEPIALIHPPVKGLQGAQSSGAALVSFNCDAFSSYGKPQNLNAPVGVATAFAYTTALNHLLRPNSRRKLRIGDAAVVVWSERATPAEPVIASVLGAISDEAGDTAEENRSAPIYDQLLRIAAGRWAELEPDETIRFFVLGLAPNAGRLQLRFFYTSALGDLLRNLQQHCRDILLQEPKPGVKFRHCGRSRARPCPRTRRVGPAPTPAPGKSLISFTRI